MITDRFFKSGPGTKITRKQEEAIAALLSTWTVEEAARKVGIGHRTLIRWMDKDLEFMAAYAAAQDAEYMRSMARMRQTAPGSAATLVKVAAGHRAGPAQQLRGCILLLRHVEDAIEIDKFRAEVAELERVRGKSRIAGHGAKFPRKMKKAIAALLTEPSVAAAARVAGVGYRTLVRWMRDPEFLAAYGAAAGAAFAPAVRILRRGVDTAISAANDLSKNPDIPAATRTNASDYLFSRSKAAEVQDLRSRMAALEPVGAGAGNSAPARTSRMIGRDLHQSVRRLRELWLPSSRTRMRIELVHARDGRPAGHTSVREADGRHLWLKPPEGSREGEPVPVEAPRETDPDRSELPPEVAA